MHTIPIDHTLSISSELTKVNDPALPILSEVQGFVTDSRFELEQTLEPNSVYYWRVNRIGPKCTAPGNIWSFTTTNDEL